GGKVIPYHDQAAASAAASSLDFKAAVENAVRGAVVHLKKSASKVGLLGFCMGGAVAVIGAARIPELDTAVSFYGLPPPTAASGSTGAPDVSVLSAVHPSWIQTVPARMRSVTSARARISPRSLKTRISSPSLRARSAASGGEIQRRGPGSAAASVGSARP